MTNPLVEQKVSAIISYLEKAYPEASCSLDFHNDYECLIAIVLSAQTTDQSVNRVTKELFKAYPSPEALSSASIPTIEKYLHSLGLYHHKAVAIHSLAGTLVKEYGGEVPHDKAKLVLLPGVGNKTSGVFLLERANVPAFPVDTHVGRISKRLGLAKKGDEPLVVEKKLEKIFPESKQGFCHHAFIAFGRDKCKALNPKCEGCPLSVYCLYFKKCSSTIGK